MLRYLKEYRFYIILFAFLLVPILAIDTSTREPRDYRVYDRVIISLTAPVQSVIRWVIDRTVAGAQNYLFLIHTRQENFSLYEENRRLLNQIAQLQETKKENERLRQLLNFQSELQLKSIVARVIARDVSTEFRAIRLNRGETDGILKDMAVLTEDGVVGRVLRTTPTTADVVTLLDPLFAIDSIVERSRARGVVAGITDDICQMRYALRTDDIQPGDTLISSGLGGLFPKGVRIGTVSKVRKKAFGISQDVDVKPNVDFTKLEEVMVVIPK